VVDAAAVTAPGRRTIDWLWHERGVLTASTGLVAAPGALAGPCGYDVVTDVRRIAPEADLPLSWLFEDARVDLWFAAGPRELVFVASAPGNPAADRHDLLVRRVTGRQALFVAVIAPAGRRRRIQRVAWSGPAGVRTVEIAVGGGTERWIVDRTGIRDGHRKPRRNPSTPGV
jgi:hypothetical protein